MVLFHPLQGVLQGTGGGGGGGVGNGGGGLPSSVDTTLAQVSDLNAVVIAKKTEGFTTQVSDLNAVIIVRSVT